MSPEGREPESKDDDSTLAEDIADGIGILSRIAAKLSNPKIAYGIGGIMFATSNGYHVSFSDAVSKTAAVVGVDCIDTKTYDHVLSVMQKMCTEAEANHSQCKQALEACDEMPDGRQD